MKNIVRAFVVTLALTGAVASAHTTSTASSSKIASAKLGAWPVPMCPPSDPNACGIGK